VKNEENEKLEMRNGRLWAMTFFSLRRQLAFYRQEPYNVFNLQKFVLRYLMITVFRL